MSATSPLVDRLKAEQRRLIGKAVGLLIAAVFQLALVVITFWCAWHDGDYVKATFYAVLCLWVSKDSK